MPLRRLYSSRIAWCTCSRATGSTGLACRSWRASRSHRLDIAGRTRVQPERHLELGRRQRRRLRRHEVFKDADLGGRNRAPNSRGYSSNSLCRRVHWPWRLACGGVPAQGWEVTVESWVMVMFLVHRREPWCGRSFGTLAACQPCLAPAVTSRAAAAHASPRVGVRQAGRATLTGRIVSNREGLLHLQPQFSCKVRVLDEHCQERRRLAQSSMITPGGRWSVGAPCSAVQSGDVPHAVGYPAAFHIRGSQ